MEPNLLPEQSNGPRSLEQFIASPNTPHSQRTSDVRMNTAQIADVTGQTMAQRARMPITMEKYTGQKPGDPGTMLWHMKNSIYLPFGFQDVQNGQLGIAKMEQEKYDTDVRNFAQLQSERQVQQNTQAQKKFYFNRLDDLRKRMKEIPATDPNSPEYKAYADEFDGIARALGALGEDAGRLNFNTFNSAAHQEKVGNLMIKENEAREEAGYAMDLIRQGNLVSGYGRLRKAIKQMMGGSGNDTERDEYRYMQQVLSDAAQGKVIQLINTQTDAAQKFIDLMKQSTGSSAMARELAANDKLLPWDNSIENTVINVLTLVKNLSSTAEKRAILADVTNKNLVDQMNVINNAIGVNIDGILKEPKNFDAKKMRGLLAEHTNMLFNNTEETIKLYNSRPDIKLRDVDFSLPDNIPSVVSQTLNMFAGQPGLNIATDQPTKVQLTPEQQAYVDKTLEKVKVRTTEKRKK